MTQILIAPQPRKSYGPGIFLSRVADELTRRRYKWTARPFHYLGISFSEWQYAFVICIPRHIKRILTSGKPYIVTMGKPETQQERQAAGKKYSESHQKQKEAMAEIILRSERVVFISNYVWDIWKKYFFEQKSGFPVEEKTRVIHHGLDINQFCPAGKPLNCERPFVIGMAGAIRNEYRLRTLFKTSELLEFEHRLLIIGSMNDVCKKYFFKAMQDKNLAAKTTYQPWVNPDNLAGWYRRMDCLFHPVDYEGFGIVVSEALACGVPVVVPAHGAPKEYILPGGGVTVATKQFCYDDEYCRLMAEGISKVRENHRSYSIKARQSAVENLSIEKTMNSYLEFMGLPKYIE